MTATVHALRPHETPERLPMKFRVERDVLSDAAAWVAKSLPARPAAPVLGGVLIEADDTGLALSGFDYETSTRVSLDATVGDPGRVLVSARLLADITKALPRKPVEVTADGARLSIACGSSRFALPLMPVEDYPSLPAMPDPIGVVPAETLAEAVAQVVTAAGRDDSLPMLTGIRVELDGDRITLAATDRFRLAVRGITWSPADLDATAALLVPARSLADIAKTLTGTVTLAVSDGMLGITAAGRQATTRLLDAEFPRFRQLIPAEHATAATVNVAELVGAVKRVALVTDRVAQVVLAFTADGLHLSAGNSDAGTAEEQLDAALDGEPITVAFNPGYLLDALGSLHTQHARLTFTTPNRPGLVRPVGTDGETQAEQLILLMPVRLPGSSS